MLTLYSSESDFKKKLTVIVVWSVALMLGYFLMVLMQSENISLMVKILPMIIGIFMIAGILLRCRIARGFTLVTLYFLAIFPLLVNFLVENSFIFFLVETKGVFSDIEALLSNFVWAVIFIIPIYFFSNDKSMEIFYIESNPKEHLFFIGAAILLTFLYIYLIPNPFV